MHSSLEALRVRVVKKAGDGDNDDDGDGNNDDDDDDDDSFELGMKLQVRRAVCLYISGALPFLPSLPRLGICAVRPSGDARLCSS